jgi:hypothetical protein
MISKEVMKAAMAYRNAILEEAALKVEQVGPSEGSLRLVTQGYADAIRAMKEY